MKKNFENDNFTLIDYLYEPALTIKAHCLSFDRLSKMALVRELKEEGGYKRQGIEIYPSVYYMDDGEILVLDDRIDKEYIENFVSPFVTIPYYNFFGKNDGELHKYLDLNYEEEIAYEDVFGNKIVFNEGLQPISNDDLSEFLPEFDDDIFEDSIDEDIAKFYID